MRGDSIFNKDNVKTKWTNCIITVGSVQEYLFVVDLLYNSIFNKINSEYRNRIWFRGVKSVEYDLTPSLCRKSLNIKYETKYLSKFKSKAVPYLDKLPTYWGWLFLMEHYGIPTRLMDWSKDALVALVFALDECNEYEKKVDSAVWCLNPVKLNESFSFNKYYKNGYIPNVEEDGVYKMFGPDLENETDKKPCAVIGPMNNSRIIAQKGAFTIFPHIKDILPLNKIFDSEEYLYKICIAKEHSDFILSQLMNYGINKAFLYPDLDHIAEQIKIEGF